MALSNQQKDEYQWVKQRLSAAQMAIKMKIKNGELPLEEDAQQFLSFSGDMDRLCPNQWREAMNDYMKELEHFRVAMEERNIEATVTAFEKILECKVSCHTRFRRKTS